METELHNYQIDFIKLKSLKVNTEAINWDVLNAHPTINNAYVLDARVELYAKNFKLYLNKENCAVIETSIPYLLHGHNYVELSADDLKNAIESLQNLINIDLMNAEVVQFEYGCYAAVTGSTKSYIKRIKDYPGYDLKYSSPFMKMFGFGQLNFKIYDAVANAKHKKTFTIGNYPKDGLVKYELKITNVTKHLKTKMYLKQLCDSQSTEELNITLHNHIDTIIDNSIVLNLNQDSFSLSDLMFICLKTLEDKFEYSGYNHMMEIIDLASLTPSQKSKRRKSFYQLEQKFRLTTNN